MAAEVARQTKQPTSPERAAQTLAIVGRQVDRLDRMVGDLLDSMRIESGLLELRREPSDVGQLVLQIVELYRPASRAHEIVFVEPVEAVIADCDPTRIEQVITNLVSNAVKYSPDGGRVVLTVFTEHSAAIVSVSDGAWASLQRTANESSSRSTAAADRVRSFRAWASGCPWRARSSQVTAGLSRSRAARARGPRSASAFRVASTSRPATEGSDLGAQKLTGGSPGQDRRPTQGAKAARLLKRTGASALPKPPATRCGIDNPASTTAAARKRRGAWVAAALRSA